MGKEGFWGWSGLKRLWYFTMASCKGIWHYTFHMMWWRLSAHEVASMLVVLCYNCHFKCDCWLNGNCMRELISRFPSLPFGLNIVSSLQILYTCIYSIPVFMIALLWVKGNRLLFCESRGDIKVQILRLGILSFKFWIEAKFYASCCNWQIMA